MPEKKPAPVAPEVPPQARGGCYEMDPATGKVVRVEPAPVDQPEEAAK